MALILLLACGVDPTPATDSAPALAPPAPMAIDALASRIALDLIGRRPSEAELDALDADPALLDAQIDTWLEDPGFEARMVSLYADVYRTRADHYVVGADGDIEFLDATYRAQFQRSVGEEPLRVLARVAASDLPWTDVLTGDWSMGNDYLLAHFPMEELVPGGSGWREVRYLDGRPAVGVLGTNGMWWRYTSTTDNVNRGRAAALSRVMLCDTRYEHPVDFRKSNASTQVSERIATDPVCVGCHVTLDPLASSLFGFWRHHPESYTEALRYYPGREEDWQSHGGVAPGYYGTPATSLYDVARKIADDPRFVNCAVTQVWGFLLGREPEVAELDRFDEDRAAFLDSGLRMRSLVRAVVSDPWYRSDAGDVPGATPPRRLSPDLLASSVEALTGYRWTVEAGIDVMVNDDFGYRVLDGGVDGVLVTEAPDSETATVMLVEERLAELAGAYVASHEAALPLEQRKLFLESPDLPVDPDDATLREQIVHLVRRTTGEKLALDDARTDVWVQLWTDIRAASPDALTAWGTFVSALLRSPDFVHA